MTENLYLTLEYSGHNNAMSPRMQAQVETFFPTVSDMINLLCIMICILLSHNLGFIIYYVVSFDCEQPGF